MNGVDTPIAIEVNCKIADSLRSVIHRLRVRTWQDPGKPYRDVYYLILPSCGTSDEDILEDVGLSVFSSAQDYSTVDVTREITMI